MRVGIVGAGAAGLATAKVLSQAGHEDVDGDGKSACDITVPVSEVAASTDVIARRLLWKVPRRNGRMKLEPGVAADERGGEGPVPTSLRAAIANRIELMSQDTKQIVQLATLLGPEFSVADLAIVLGRPATDLAGALTDAYRVHVLVDSGGRTMFLHPLIREALYDAIPEGLRAALHRQAAQALAGAGVPVERVAEQLEAAPGVMDSWVLNWLVDNGAALVNRASQPAIDLLSRAADHVPRTDPRREAIESRLVAALRRMLRFGEVEQQSRAALARRTISAEHRLEMSWGLAYSLLYSDPPQAAKVARAALHGDNGGRWGARLRALYALIVAVDGHIGNPWPAIRDAHAAGQRTGDSWTTATTLNAESMVLGQHPSMSAGLLRQALAAIGHDPRTADLRVVLLVNLCLHLDHVGHLGDAEAAVADMLAFVEKYPSAIAPTRARAYAAVWFYDVGRWDEALAEMEHGCITVEAISVAALIAGHRDDRAAAATHLGRLARTPVPGEVIQNHSSRLILARALAEERDGRQHEAFGVLASLLSPEMDIAPAERSRLLPELVRLALTVGERDIAEVATRLAVEDAKRESLPLRVAAAAACRGLLAKDPELLLDAAERYRAIRRFLDRGMALENAAVLLGEQGKLPEARTMAAAAIEEYTKLAATWDITRAEARMRPFGISRGQRGPRGRPAYGWDSLTPTELRVAFLVADGLSNPDIATELFLSPRTVQTHVSHILTKMDARSRAEIAVQASRHRADGRDGWTGVACRRENRLLENLPEAGLAGEGHVKANDIQKAKEGPSDTPSPPSLPFQGHQRSHSQRPASRPRGSSRQKAVHSRLIRPAGTMRYVFYRAS
jgi:DNA-binding CsgD family transcriptional regulator